MENSGNTMRFQLLAEQHKLDHSLRFFRDFKDSLERMFWFLYRYTDITFIEFVNEEILQGYIKFHRSKNFSKVNFQSTVKDVLNYIYFLENVKGIKDTPNIDLSVSNFSFWKSL